eukprot:3468845-Karenia_brevis.AAC.1
MSSDKDGLSQCSEEAAVDAMTLEQLRAEMVSLNRQAAAIKDLKDPGSLKLRSYLQKEITS